MTNAEKVDRGRFLSASIKKMEDELEEIKKTLKAHAKKHTLLEIAGKKAVAKFSPTGWTSVDSLALFKKMKALKQKDKFWKLVKVQIGPAKKLLGEVVFEDIADTGSIPYNKITFKDS